MIEPWARPALTPIVISVPPAGTVTDVGYVIRESVEPIVPAPNGASVPVAGVNRCDVTVNAWLAPDVFARWMRSVVGVVCEPLILPNEADTGVAKIVAEAASVRSSRPAPCAIGPTFEAPELASLTTRSAVLTRADLTIAGVQVGWMSSSTAAEPARCGVAIDVPLRNSHVCSPPQVVPAGARLQAIELRTLTPTDVTSGLIARSTFVGPMLLKLARMSPLVVTMSAKFAGTDAVVACEARSAAASSRPTMTAGRSSAKPAVLAMPTGSPATLLTMSTPRAPAVFALATFWLNAQVPRLMIASLPAAAVGTLAQPSPATSKSVYVA